MEPLSPIVLNSTNAQNNSQGNGALQYTDSLTNALNNINQSIKGVQNVDRGSLQNLVAMPTQTIITVASAAGGGAVTITANLFNEDFLNVTPTNNGSGAGSVVTTYNDGFTGNLISHISGTYGNKGLRVKQLQIQYINSATLAQDPAAAQAANPTLTTYNGDGSSLPQIVPIASTGNPSYQQSGFLIVNVDFTIKRYSQISLLVPAGDVATVVVVYDNQQG